MYMCTHISFFVNTSISFCQKFCINNQHVCENKNSSKIIFLIFFLVICDDIISYNYVCVCIYVNINNVFKINI